MYEIPLLKVLVGKDQAEFWVPKNLVCSHSDFFKAACSKQWASGITNTVTLEEEDLIVFGMFLTWLLDQTPENHAEYITVPNSREYELSKTTKAEIAARLRDIKALAHQAAQLIDCYILGDFLLADAFCNKVIDLLIISTKNFQTISFMTSIELTGTGVSKVFSNTSDQSPLKILLVDLFMHNTPAGGLDIYNDAEMPGLSTFFSMVAQRAIEKSVEDEAKKQLNPYERDACYYHIHRTKKESCDYIVGM